MFRCGLFLLSSCDRSAARTRGRFANLLFALMVFGLSAPCIAQSTGPWDFSQDSTDVDSSPEAQDLSGSRRRQDRDDHPCTDRWREVQELHGWPCSEHQRARPICEERSGQKRRSQAQHRYKIARFRGRLTGTGLHTVAASTRSRWQRW